MGIPSRGEESGDSIQVDVFSQSLWGKGGNISTGNLQREFGKLSTYFINSIPWLCSRSAHPEFVSKQTLQEQFLRTRMVFCANLESKDFRIIAYSNKNPVAYQIFWLIGELIAYLTTLNHRFLNLWDEKELSEDSWNGVTVWSLRVA